MVRYIGGITERNLTVEQISQLPVSSYEFLPRNNGDIAKSIVMNQDVDAGVYALAKIAAGATAFASVPVAGVAMMLSTIGSDLYGLYHSHKQDNNSFWNEYFSNMREVQNPDPAWRETIEGLAASPFLTKTADTVNMSRNGWYSAGQLAGRLAFDTSTFLIGGAKFGQIALPISMGLVEGINTYTEELALTDGMKAPLWPAVSAGISAGATGMLFMHTIPHALEKIVPRFTGAGMNSSWGSLARNALPEAAKGGVIGSAEFAAWNATDSVLHGILNGEWPEINGDEMAYSAALGAILGGSMRGLGVVGHWRKIRADEAAANVKDSQPTAVEGPQERPKIAEPVEEIKLVEPERTVAWAETPLAQNEIASYEKMSVDYATRGKTKNLSIPEAAFIADRTVKRYRENEARIGRLVNEAAERGEKIDITGLEQPLDYIVGEKLRRYGGAVGPDANLAEARFREYQTSRFVAGDETGAPGIRVESRPYTQTVFRESGGDGRYYNDENLKLINKFIYKRLPESKPLGNVEDYYLRKRGEYFPETTEIAQTPKGYVAEKKPAWQHYADYESGLNTAERIVYERALEDAAENNIGGYGAKAKAKKAVDDARRRVALNIEKTDATQAIVERREAELFGYEGLNKELEWRMLDGQTRMYSPEFMSQVIEEAATRRGIAHLVLGTGNEVVGNEKERFKKFVQDAKEIASREVLKRGGTIDEAVAASDEAIAYAQKFQFDNEWLRKLEDIDRKIISGKLTAEQAADYRAEMIEEYVKTRKNENKQAGAGAATIMRDIVFSKKGKAEFEFSKFLNYQAAMFNGVIPASIRRIIMKAAGHSYMGRTSGRKTFDFRKFQKAWGELSAEYLDAMNTYNYAKKMAGVDDMGRPIFAVSRKEVEKAAEKKAADLAAIPEEAAE